MSKLNTDYFARCINAPLPQFMVIERSL